MTIRNRDAEDVKAAARGDEQAFTRLYDFYRDRIYGFAYRMTRDQTIAEDATHEAFLALIERPERYDAERASLLTFLCAVARNQVFKYFRRCGYEYEEYAEEGDWYSLKDESEADPLSALLDREMTTKIGEAVALLPALQREVIILREFQELSYEEISAVTGADVNVVKARLYRARQSLARHLASYMVLSGGQCDELRKS